MNIWSRLGVRRRRAKHVEYDYVERWRALWTAPVVIHGETRQLQAHPTLPAKPELLRLNALREKYRAGRRKVG